MVVSIYVWSLTAINQRSRGISTKISLDASYWLVKCTRTRLQCYRNKVNCGTWVMNFLRTALNVALN